jgi:hypothetical protein
MTQKHPNSSFNITCIRLCGVALLLCVGVTAFAQNNYVRTEIDRSDWQSRGILEDLNGDGRLDFIVSHWQQNLGRELLIHFQLEDGRFSPTPRSIEIKTEIIAVGFADLRAEPGKELVLLANNGVFSLSPAVDGYAGNLKPLFEWKLIADIPDPDRVQFFEGIEDLNGDGFVDIVMPGEKTFGVFAGGPNETFELVAEFSTINLELEPASRPVRGDNLTTNLNINSRDGIKLEVRSTRPSPYLGFVEDWKLREEAEDDLLQAENWMPSISLADMNADQLTDIIFLNVGLDIRGQVNVLFQQADGQFPGTPDWQGSIDTRGDLSLVDLDGDQMMDMVKLTGDGNEWDAFLYKNKGGSFDFDEPDQVMRFSGYDVDLNFVDLDMDGRPELNVSFYTIDIVDAIRNTSIVRTQLLYRNEATGTGQIFARRPQSRLEESFSASNVRSLAEQMSLRFDIDNDAAIDAIYIADDGTLAAKHIDAALNIASEPFWQFVPSRTIIGFTVRHLNSDDIPDLVLRHGSAVTLLVGTP